MNKSLKLNLKDLRVNSFVTSLEKDDVERIKGGWVTTTAVFTNPLDYLCNSYQCPLAVAKAIRMALIATITSHPNSPGIVPE